MIINVRVKPNSKEDSIEIRERFYEIHLKERAEDNKANIALVKMLSKHFKVHHDKISIISGKTSRRKKVRIDI